MLVFRIPRGLCNGVKYYLHCAIFAIIMNISHLYTLIKKEFDLEFRQSHALFGVLLFAACTVFIIFKAFNTLGAFQWNVMLWIIVVFSGINAVAKSFVQENKETYLHYYTLFDPLELILAKLIYNFLFIVVIIALVILLLTIFTMNPIVNWSLFTQGALLGALGLACIFTFIAALSGIDRGGTTIMSVMALPLVLPVILLLIKITAVSMGLMVDTEIGGDLMILGGIDLMICGLMLLLFPIIWRS